MKRGKYCLPFQKIIKKQNKNNNVNTIRNSVEDTAASSGDNPNCMEDHLYISPSPFQVCKS